MKKIITIVFASFALFSCSSDKNEQQQPVEDSFIRAADLSFLPEIEAEGTTFTHDGIAEDALTTLKNEGCNTVRIRLWKNPSGAHSGLAEVKTLAQRAKNAGLKVWITVHYSDTWADPGNQAKPVAWSSLSLAELKTAVASYTTEVVDEIHPDIIQIGNETNDGFLFPTGKLSTNEAQYLELVQAATSAVRAASSSTKIMLHFAGITGSDWFFSKTAAVDYDYIGLSYYPVWHGKNLSELQNTVNALSAAHNKKVIIAETAYPFTLGWNDWTNNIVGLEEQLIPAYPATADGQKNFLAAIKTMLQQTDNGIGFCYWGGEWISFRGDQATNGSTWENQALWDFDNNSLPIMDVFNQD
jgi:arabinogalactan endo-1,4-beta-galactosidase